MRTRGFTIGSHSVSHIDCAAETTAVVTEELARSRDDLGRELGCTAPIFAYPYGGRMNMTPKRLELVKRAGYVGCLSAYGGSNVRSVDRYNVLRRGINWEFDDTAFMLECYGVT
jgi:peptidoglycan/xylan/chitin deacetylase (PgdA/CDA1 family)